MYNRFFSFGCSFTQHLWPTWADIVAMDLKIPFQNWGKSSAGNCAIQSRIVECDFENNFTKDDLVVVMWSGWNREDRFVNEWLCGGIIFNNSNYDQNFIEKYWSEENDCIKNTTAIHTTYKAYKDIIKYHATITAPNARTEFDSKYISTTKSSIVDRILNNFSKKSVNLNLFDETKNTAFNGKSIDRHPDILAHLYFVQNSLYPALKLKINQPTVDFCHDYFQEASKRLTNQDSYDSLKTKILKLNSTMGFEQKFWGI